MYDAIRSGRVRSTPGVLKEREGKTASKSRNYVLNRLDKGVDWQGRLPEGAGGLGGIEGNEAHQFADRMKDRGMSWAIAGAVHMGKAIQLAFNGELRNWSGRKPLSSVLKKSTLSFDLFDELDGYGKRTGLPALEGSHASRPWVRVLKGMTSPYNPLN